MCGIIGYVGKREVAPILLCGLERMEYRGYDSAGIAVHESGAPALRVIKSVGKIAQLRHAIRQFEITRQSEISQNANTTNSTNSQQKSGSKVVDTKSASTNSVSTIGIGHTRWATHGEPSERNAHPHVNSSTTIAVVHNGIIENATKLRDRLQNEGYSFVSQTDTETIVHLIDFHFKRTVPDFEAAFRLALSELEGTYGVVAIVAGERTLYAARKGSPLIIGVGEQEMFVASDAAALIESTRTVQYLQDGDVAIISQFGYRLSTLGGNEQPVQTSQIEWSLAEAQKNGHAHFMIKEIFEQPQVVQNTIRGRLRDGRVKLTITLPAQINKVHIVACGTSYHAGLIGKYYIESLARIPVELHIASEFRYSDPVLNKDDIVVALSQSGETADTLAAVLEAKRRNITTIGLVNVVGSSIAREVTSGVYIHAGVEIGVASTKAFTCQVVSLLLLSLAIAQHAGKQVSAQLQNTILHLSEYIDAVLDLDEQIRSAAKLLDDATSAIYLGRNTAYPVALEGALKLKEISYIHAEGFAAGEMKHGPIALVDEKTPVVCIVQKSHITEKMISNIQEIRARHGRVIAVSEVESDELSRLCEHVIYVPHIMPELSPILLTIPLQLLAYYAAVARGCDVDKPRNLAKSVTVE